MKKAIERERERERDLVNMCKLKDECVCVCSAVSTFSCSHLVQFSSSPFSFYVQFSSSVFLVSSAVLLFFISYVVFTCNLF